MTRLSQSGILPPMLIKIDKKGAVAIPPGEYLEKHVEAAVEKAPELFLGMDLLLIGRQVRTDRGIVDLLGLDRDGNVVIIELKRYDSPREIVSQAISYRSHFRKAATAEHLNQIAATHFGQDSDGGALLKARLKGKFGIVPQTLNKKQIVVLVATHFPDGVLDDLEEVLDHVCIQFSYYKSDGAEFFSVKRVSDPNLAHVSTTASKPKLTDFDSLFTAVISEVKRTLPKPFTTFKNTLAHRSKDQWVRFHWGGMDTHVGLWAKKGSDGPEISVYFWSSDTEVVDTLKSNADSLRRALGLARDDVFDPDKKQSIDKSVDERSAAQTVASFISTLKPLLGDRF